MAKPDLEERIGYRFRPPACWKRRFATAPRSRGERGESNERLEFSGSGAELCIAHESTGCFPGGRGDPHEGEGRGHQQPQPRQVGDRIGVPPSLTIDPSVRRKGAGGITRKMVADAVEAIIGAIFIDGGYDASFAFVRSHFRLADL
jgi:ribonuclease-3